MSGTLRESEAWAYLVRCADGTLYAGWTTDTARRLAAHNAPAAAGRWFWPTGSAARTKTPRCAGRPR